MSVTLMIHHVWVKKQIKSYSEVCLLAVIVNLTYAVLCSQTPVELRQSAVKQQSIIELLPGLHVRYLICKNTTKILKTLLSLVTVNYSQLR